MRLEFISPFVHSAHSVLETLLGAAPTRGEPSLQGKGFHGTLPGRFLRTEDHANPAG